MLQAQPMASMGLAPPGKQLAPGRTLLSRLLLGPWGAGWRVLLASQFSKCLLDHNYLYCNLGGRTSCSSDMPEVCATGLKTGCC